jgi:hypothetical protein
MKYLIAILLFASTALAQNNSGTLVIAPIRPQASNDTFPSAIANEIQGGPFSVGTLTAMSNIPSARLVSGATAYVTNDAGLRLWNGTTWSSENFRTAIGLGATNDVSFATVTINGLGDPVIGIDALGISVESTNTNTPFSALLFVGNGAAKLAENTRAELRLGATWLTNTNVTNFRTAIGLGATNSVSFRLVELTEEGSPGATAYNEGGNFVIEHQEGRIGEFSDQLSAFNTTIQTSGNLIISNQSATNNGLLFIYRTNNEPFLGLANLIASNNTTISNETLFRVGVAEATNRAAQFGFRSTNTNGNGVAVFSVFGFDALMMIGSDASTNAVVYSGGGINNEVMTLIKNGATEFARPISFSSTAHAGATRTNLALGATNDPAFRDVSVRDLSIVAGSGGKIVYPATNTAPANTTNPVTWIQVNVGTNSYRVPLYQ